MKPNEGRLQTSEHILAHIVQDIIADARVSMARFDKEDEGTLEISTLSDLRSLPLKDIESAVNSIIKRNLDVTKKVISRLEAKEFDLSRLPPSVTEIRIVDISSFDRRPCKDPHVNNTSEIGHFVLKSVERAGKDRYKFRFSVE